MRFYSTNFFFRRVIIQIIRTCFAFSIFINVTIAQVADKKIADKLLPSLRLQLQRSEATGTRSYTIHTSSLQQFETLLKKNKSIKLISVYQPANLAVIECKWSDLEKIMSDPSIRSADIRKQPKEELLFGF